MQKVISLNNSYATTCLCLRQKQPNDSLQTGAAHKKSAVVPQKSGVFDLQDHAGFPGPFSYAAAGGDREGGLRRFGWIKHSYKKISGQWYIVDDEGKALEPVELESVEEYEELPLISIVTVVYNGKAHLEETIKSVISQSYPNIEYIIIDGGSDDGTLDIIRKYEDRIDYWVSERDEGIYDAMNKGMRQAHGKWVNFMNAGDRMLYLNPSDLVERSRTFSNYFYDKKRRKIFRNPISWLYMTRNMPCHQSIIYRRSELVEFDKNIPVVADYCQLLAIMQRIQKGELGTSLVFFDDPGVSNMDKHSCSQMLRHWQSRNRCMKRYGPKIFYVIALIHTVRLYLRCMIKQWLR